MDLSITVFSKSVVDKESMDAGVYNSLFVCKIDEI
jgi:hypothetical protein